MDLSEKKRGIFMKYVTYREDNVTVNEEKCERVKKNIVQGNGKVKWYQYILRKLRFSSEAGKDGQDRESIPRFYLCLLREKNKKIRLYLEKKYQQNGVYFKACEEVTEEECRKIMDGKVEWMKNHKKQIFQDFYLQYTLNKIRPWHVTEYERETAVYPHGEYLTFNKKIRRIVGGVTDLFDEESIRISCLTEGRVMVSSKKLITLPAILREVLQNAEDSIEKMAFAN